MIGIRSDPNGPWHYDEESGDTWLVDGVRDPEFLNEVNEGGIVVGRLIALFTEQGDPPYEIDWAYVRFGVIRRLVDASSSGNGSYVLVYTELVDD